MKIKKNNQNAILPDGIGTKYCPHCAKEVINRKPDDYNDDEIHPCEHCGGLILWTPTWSWSDLRD